ncbi:unnamed protein product [Closterium sp. NIES-54]
MAAYLRIAIPATQLSILHVSPFNAASSRDIVPVPTVLPATNRTRRRDRFLKRHPEFASSGFASMKNAFVRGTDGIPFEIATHSDNASTAALAHDGQRRAVVAAAGGSNSDPAVTCDTPAVDLAGQTIVVVGLGASGRAAARLALARGAAAVIGLDRRTDAKLLEVRVCVWGAAAMIGLDRKTDAKALEMRVLLLLSAPCHVGPWLGMCGLARGAAAVIGLDRRTDAKALEGFQTLPPLPPSSPTLQDDPSVWDGLPDPASSPPLVSRLSTHLGPHTLPLLLSASLVVLSPGVPLSEPTISQALSQGVPMLSELAFAYDSLPPGLPMAAVTGTNGKSTVATFAGQILESIGIHTFVGGNLGTPLSLAALDFVTSSQHGHSDSSKRFQAAVVEVSSYQMELPGRFRPKAAVILNLTPDHLERHGNMESYGAAKCRLFAHMGESDVAIIPSGDPLLTRLAGEAGGHPSMAWLGKLPGCTANHAERMALLQLPLSTTSASADSGRESSSEGRESKESSKGHSSSTGDQAPVLTLDLSTLQAVGRHNADNAAVAALLCLALGMESSGVRLDGVQSAVRVLQPPPHRMELGERGGAAVPRAGSGCRSAGVLQPPPHRMELVVVDGQDRAWINDSKATNVEASMAGIEGLGDESTAVILLGGIAKVQPMVGGREKEGWLSFGVFGQSGPSIASELTAANLSVALTQCSTMEQAMHAAAETALPGDTILLSPACASFDEFDNFEHRGRVFTEIAQNILDQVVKGN